MSDIDQTRIQRIGNRLITLLVRFIVVLLTRRKVTGEANIPRQGPLLVVTNHTSMADQFFAAYYVRRKMRYIAKEELFRPLPMKLLLEAFGAFPVRRGILDRRTLNQARQVLDSGGTLFVFPEGTRSRDAKLQPAYPGTAIIALHNNVPILPIGITGLEHVRDGPFWWIVRRYKVTVHVNIGKVFYLPAGEENPSKTRLRELSDSIMEHIAELLPPEYQGYYAKRETPHESQD
jgi:1-acyl-sn-glycerol-3-phosphate acyltransferase